MPTLTVPAPPTLARVNRVELVHTGSWNALSGPVTFTDDDLAAAVGAMDCPAVRRAVLKFGHTPPHGAGDPAIGWVDNLALGADGHTLIGDFVGMPAWLATPDGDGVSVLTAAYPDRSIEGTFGHVCQLGHTHPFVLEAVALLGVERPAVGTLPSLQDLAAVYGVQLADGSGTSGVPVRVRLAASAHSGAMVALLPSEVDAARLAVDDGEPAADLHVTLMYLGDGANYSTDDRAALVDAVTTAAPDAFEADGFALSVFNPGETDQDRESCIVLGLGGDRLEPAMLAARAAVDGVGLAQVPEQHTPWVAHLTLAYTDDLTKLTDLVDRVGPVTFDRIRVAFAGEHTDIPLAPAADGDPIQAGRSPSMPNPRPAKVAASVSVEDVRREYYDKAPWSYWIVEVHLDPLQLIVVDDDSGSRWRVPVTVTGEDAFEFGEPVQVLVRYVDKTAEVAASTAKAPVVYASRAESRPGDRPAASEPPAASAPAGAPDLPAAEPEPNTEPKEEDPVSDLSGIRSRLGLDETADEQAILAALDSRLQPEPDPDPEPTPDVETVTEPEKELVSAGAKPLPDGVVTIDKATLDALRNQAALGAAAHERQRVADRDAVISAAMGDGKFAPARKDHWVKAWEADPEGTKATLASLEPGLVVPTVAAGVSGSGEPEPDELGGVSETALDGWAAQLGIDPKELARG